MIISSVQNTRNNNQKNNAWVRPVVSGKNDHKRASEECSYQMLQKQAMMRG